MDSKPTVPINSSGQIASNNMPIVNIDRFLARPEAFDFRKEFQDAFDKRANPARHGDLASWLDILEQLPKIKAKSHSLNCAAITIGSQQDIDQHSQQQLEALLRDLSPWRKGPYQIFGSYIDTEWRSDWKWDRVAPHISDLSGRTVLDVGCGTGYHCWRMLGDGADYVLGIDPSMRFFIQYLAIQVYLQDSRFDFLPIGIEDMPPKFTIFDSVFSMGVLYHRRNPINHLKELYRLLTPGGELILETLIIDEAVDGIFRPPQRYAMMRNVWSIMTIEKVETLLAEAGFHNIRCVDQNTTSLEEQRSTEWMTYHSLEQYLDPEDRSKTIEGHPAPKRAFLVCNRPCL